MSITPETLTILILKKKHNIWNISYNSWDNSCTQRYLDFSQLYMFFWVRICWSYWLGVKNFGYYPVYNCSFRNFCIYHNIWSKIVCFHFSFFFRYPSPLLWTQNDRQFFEKCSSVRSIYFCDCQFIRVIVLFIPS